jgi:hypothetical protein
MEEVKKNRRNCVGMLYKEERNRKREEEIKICFQGKETQTLKKIWIGQQHKEGLGLSNTQLS